MKSIDEPIEVREGEQINQKNLEMFLKSHIPDLNGELIISQFPSGFSNLTYLLKLGEREMVLRKPPYGKKAKSAHDMAREYKILNALKPVFPYAPTPLLYSEELDIIGSPFYLMERVKGIILRKKLPKELMLSKIDARKLCENLISVFYELHSIDYKAIGLEDFGKPEGYVRRQVDGWSKRYMDARTDDVPDFEKVMQWMQDNMPKDCKTSSIIHNDYKFDNVVLNHEDPLHIIGVLDWEMATIGDPLMDLGSSLAYWVNRDDPENLQMIRQMPTTLEGMMTREELIEFYLSKTGLKVESFDFYLCFGIFRLAVIAQQIYYRFYHGQTKDKRFQMLAFAVKILEETALKLINNDY
ncbi:MAG: phosphotransferase family protein [Desulfobacterales bacterium]|nr:phosphotransferase family protein [Desulfobacterales bacterium]MBF0395591.1 phosphotransferase family protein [Desulfobacterales bacterium]